jgi:hypothetical protein
MRDKHGYQIDLGDTVLVPDPDPKLVDAWQHSFAGQVDSLRTTRIDWTKRGQDLVTVVDGDGDCFDIEPERISTQEV